MNEAISRWSSRRIVYCNVCNKELHRGSLSSRCGKHRDKTKAIAKIKSLNRSKESNSNWKGGAEHNKLKSKAWRKDNYQRVLFLNRLRRIRKLGSKGIHTLHEWNDLKELYKYTCPSCKQTEPDIKLTVDHITPLSKGGTDYISNIQPLCKSCNSKKNTKTIKYEQF